MTDVKDHRRKSRFATNPHLSPLQTMMLAAVYYPYTILEVAAMTLGTWLVTLVLKIRYARIVFPDSRRKTEKYARREALMDSDLAVMAMEEVERLASATGAAPYWISGTLLGLERIGKPLAHDYDLDLGINASDPFLHSFLIAINSSTNFQNVSARYHGVKRRIQNPDLSVIPDGLLRYTFEYNRDANSAPVKIDLFLHYLYGSVTIHLSRYTIWWNSPFGTEKRRYRSMLFSVPIDRKKYLRENYGDFSVEQKDFENSIDCPNVFDIYSWDSLIYLLRRRKLMIKLGRADKEKLVAKRIWKTIRKGLWPCVQAR